MAFDGAEKNNKATRRLPAVKVTKAKSKKPDPRVCIPGGETKIETRSNVHQTKLRKKKRNVKYLRNRTVQRLYGETAGSSGSR